MNYKKSYYILSAGLIAGAAIEFIGIGLSMKSSFPGYAAVFIGFSAMFGSIVQAFIFCRCPKCGTLLKIRGRKPNCCYGCGHRLNL